MVVAFDSSEAADPELRGWGRYVRDLGHALAEIAPARGFELERLVPRGSGPEILWEQIELPRRLRSSRAALVHSPNCFLPLRRPCPGIVTIHDLAFEDHPRDFSRRTGWKYRTFAPRAVRSAERVICVSRFTAEDVRRRYGIDEERIRVIHPAASLPHTGAEPPGGPYLLAVGDLRAKKNLTRLVEAFGLLRRDGLPHRLVIAGADAGAGSALGDAARGLPVELTGYVSDERLDALMRGADVLVHPSLQEGFGLVLVEAMARGVPVACSGTSALPETGAGACAYFDPEDAADIARVVGEVAGDRALRDDLAARGRRRAEDFSWERAAAETAELYLEVAA